MGLRARLFPADDAARLHLDALVPPDRRHIVSHRFSRTASVRGVAAAKTS